MKYDKTLREIFNSTPVTLIKLLTGKEIKENLNPKFPSMEEREVDFLVRLENDEIFHLEIQSMNDKNMPIRMLRYAILIENRYEKFPIQAVLYVGDKKLNIKNEIKFNNLQYSYKLMLRTFQPLQFIICNSVGFYLSLSTPVFYFLISTITNVIII